MIKNLLKYDLKKMTNLLLYLYPIAILVAIIARLFSIGKNIQIIFIIGQVFGGITYSLIGSILVNTFVQILVTFNQSFYKDQSYLTHTLPIEKSKLLLSKYLSALIVILTSIIVSVLSLFIVLYSDALMQGLKSAIQVMVQGFNMSGTGFVLIMAGIIFTQICFLISSGFLAIVKSHTYNEKRTLKGLAWFALYYMISMCVTLIVVVIEFLIMGDLEIILSEQIPAKNFTVLMITALLLNAIYAVLFYFSCNKLFNKGVNVD